MQKCLDHHQWLNTITFDQMDKFTGDYKLIQRQRENATGLTKLLFFHCLSFWWTPSIPLLRLLVIHVGNLFINTTYRWFNEEMFMHEYNQSDTFLHLHLRCRISTRVFLPRQSGNDCERGEICESEQLHQELHTPAAQEYGTSLFELKNWMCGSTNKSCQILKLQPRSSNLLTHGFL